MADGVAMSEAAVSTSSKVFVSMLGGCTVEVDGQVVSGVPSSFFRVAAYLVLSAGVHSVSRQRLSSLLWPELDQEKSGANLRQLVARIKHFQERNGFQLIGSNFVSIFMLRNAAVQCDLQELLTLLAEGGPGSIIRLCRLYSGDLLVDLPDSGNEYEDWLCTQRERLRGRLTERWLDAISSASDLSDLERHAAATSLLELDPGSEPACRVLMTDAAHRGDLSGLHAIYHACKDHLMAEYGVAPSSETTALYARLVQKP